MNAATISRRDWLKAGTVLGGAALTHLLVPPAVRAALLQRGTPTPAEAAAATRKQIAATPIETTKLTDTLTMFSGPGGNVVALNGPDGKVVVDTFILGAFDPLKQRLDTLGPAPIKLAINTHWHFDHTDNNQSFRAAGAGILAHANTTKRMSQSHDMLGMHLDAWPAAALPTQTFTQTQTVNTNGERIDVGYIPPAHTDTDIYIHFTRANVLHLGDTFFNGAYPFIDASTGGSINGTIAAAERGLKLASATTKIVPGHGPVADRGALTKYRDVLVTVRDRVQKLKTAGRNEKEVIAAKPGAEFDATWGAGFMQPDVFIGIVYNTL
jgi:glyoxylase-like metal-dependent hydrolase (beta-lactamase superfamily II)